jgi:hypothetical protein
MKTTTPFFSNLSNVEKVLIAILGLLTGCLLCIIPLRSVSNFLSESGGNDRPNNPIPTKIQRPDYERMLGANGFVYLMRDGEGNPSYVSPCEAVATVKSDSVGFAASNSDTSCAAKDIGAIISIMYPSEVFDFVFTAMNSLNGFDQVVTGKAVGYDISVTITEYEYTLVVIIRDPR